jgi:hypothetical protein
MGEACSWNCHWRGEERFESCSLRKSVGGGGVAMKRDISVTVESRAIILLFLGQGLLVFFNYCKANNTEKESLIIFTAFL